jgi:beta-N-acetylhexosaminidase
MAGPQIRLAIAGVLVLAATSLAMLPPAPTGAATASDVSDVTASLSPAQLAGQRVIYSYTGLTPPAKLLWLIGHGQAAGVIFFRGNITGHAQIRAVIAKLEKANARSSNPVRAPCS